MNGYKLLADSYRAYLDENEASPIISKDMQSRIKALDFLGECTQRDINNLFNTGAFNDIVKGYVTKAAEKNATTRKAAAQILEALGILFEEMGAQEALEHYQNRLL